MAQQLTPLPGELHLNPEIAPQVPTGMPRPFAPGEWIQNHDGSWSSEISVTVTNPAINNGAPTVLPSLWIVNGQAVRVPEDMAASFAMQSGLNFPAFTDIPSAEQFATSRETQ